VHVLYAMQSFEIHVSVTAHVEVRMQCRHVHELGIAMMRATYLRVFASSVSGSAGRICAAYVLPRTTRLSNMMFEGSPF
jgi:uncharacterized membrane protein